MTVYAGDAYKVLWGLMELMKLLQKAVELRFEDGYHGKVPSIQGHTEVIPALTYQDLK